MISIYKSKQIKKRKNKKKKKKRQKSHKTTRRLREYASIWITKATNHDQQNKNKAISTFGESKINFLHNNNNNINII